MSATNAIGTTTSPAPSSEAFTTLSERPDVFTGGVDSITSTNATLTGQVNPNGAPVTDCHFDYWTGSGTHQQAPCSPPAPFGGASPVNVDATLSGLSPGTTYSWDLSATNANGTVTSAAPSSEAFTTSAPPASAAPQVSTDLPNGADEHTINLSGVVNPEGSQTDWYFQYSAYPDVAYAEQTANDSGTGPLNGNSSQQVGAGISSYGGNGFNPNTTMYYRVVGVNAGGTTYGNILQGTTSSAAVGITVHYLDSNFQLQSFASNPPSSPFDAGSEQPMDWGCSVDGLPSAEGIQHCQISVTDDQGNSYQIAPWTNDDATGVDSAQADLPTNCSGSSTCHFKIAVTAQDLYGDSKSVQYGYSVNPAASTAGAQADTSKDASHTAGSLKDLLAGGLAPFNAKYGITDQSGNIVGWYMNDGSIIAAGSGNLISDNGAGWQLSGADGRIIAAGSGNIISAGSGNIIAAGSGNIIAAGSGNLISDNGAGWQPSGADGRIIAAGSGNIIGAGGANIIGAGSGNIIGAGGANIIGAGGGNFHAVNEPVAAAAAAGKPVTLYAGGVSRARRRMLASDLASFGIGNFTTKITLRLGTGKHGRNVTLATGAIQFIRVRQVRTMMLTLTKAGVRLLARITHDNLVRRRHHQSLLRVTLTVRDVFSPKLKGKLVVATRRVTVAPGSRIRLRKR